MNRHEQAACNVQGLFDLLDRSPDNLAVYTLPKGAPADVRAKMLTAFGDMVERARADRPDLAVRTAPPHGDFMDAEMLLSVHEHRWHDGRCPGCDARRDSFDG